MIDFEILTRFGEAAGELRRAYPEFAREIDRMSYDVGKRYIPECEHAKCDCKMTFEQYHAERSRRFETDGAGRRRRYIVRRKRSESL